MDVCDGLFPFLVAIPDLCATRRRILLAPLLAAVPFAMAGTRRGGRPVAITALLGG